MIYDKIECKFSIGLSFHLKGFFHIIMSIEYKINVREKENLNSMKLISSKQFSFSKETLEV